MNDFFRKWALAALVNFMLVATAGVLLRYKILFHLPIVNHKNLLHAHSHFAFSGWVSLALCTAIVYVMHSYSPVNFRKYRYLFYFSQFSSFGMLLSFPFMGYAAISITFSTLYIVFSYLFTIIAWKDLNRSEVPIIIQKWFKSGMLLWVISSIGAFSLAYMMATKSGSQSFQIGSIYFFLHFQYNGWFLFAIAGLFFNKLFRSGITDHNNNIYKLLLVAVGPAFLLSALWMRIPMFIYAIAILGAVIQLVAIYYLWRIFPIIKEKLKFRMGKLISTLWILALLAVLLKFLFQAVSTVPALSHLAFGFRPIVIGFLHLILLGFVSLFIVGYLFEERFFALTKLHKTGISILIVGVLLNEAVLFIQGIAAMNYNAVPYSNHMLLGISILLFASLALLVFSGTGSKEKDVHLI